MLQNHPLIKILRQIKIKKNETALDMLILYLYKDKKMTVPEIVALLGISISSVYKALKVKS